MIAWNPFEYGDQTYDLSHLHPKLVIYTQAAKGCLPERRYEVQLSYSLHCFTRKYAPEENPESSMAYSDSRETRLFDFHRYACSKHLPAIVDALPTSHCYHTGHGNFFTFKLLNPATGEPETYEVYFEASRSGTKPTKVNLFVQSAYVRDRQHSNQPTRKKKISFFVILHNTLNAKPIKSPPK
jgi:hypothetical protein